MLNAGRLSKPLCVAIARRGCWLPVALALAAIAPRAEAAGPGLLDYFRACGIGDDAFARFSDDRQVAAEELNVIRRIAVRCATGRRTAPTHVSGPLTTCPTLPEGFPRPRRPRAGVGGCSNSKVPSSAVEPVEDRTASRSGDAP